MQSTALVNHYYFYCLDRDCGPFFLKFCSYFPGNAKLYLNGHEYVKRQLEPNRKESQALDNGVLCCADPNAYRLSPTGSQQRRSKPGYASGCGYCLIPSRVRTGKPDTVISFPSCRWHSPSPRGSTAR